MILIYTYFFLSVISYSFFLAAIFNFSNWIGLNYRLSILSLIVAALFPQIFSFSAHLLRQFFSVSVGFYALSLFFSGFKRKLAIFILFISCLIHSSNLLLFSLVFIGSPFKKLFKWSFLLIPVIIYLYSKISWYRLLKIFSIIL